MPTNSAGRNYKRTKESSLFGTRKLAFYTLYASTDYGLAGAFTSGYSFRVSTTTGAVTFNADITPKDIGDMYLDYDGLADEEGLGYTLPFTIDFVGGFTGTAIYINSNGGMSFGSNSAHYASNSIGSGTQEIFIANNDANVQFVYTDNTVNGEFRIKVRGNTDYNNEVVNMTWEALFRDGANYIDFFVSEQPTDWNDYNDNQGDVYWGVTDGNDWVDGLSTHTESFAPFTATSEESWKEPNSIYYKVVQALQQAGAELYWLGTPHNTQEPTTVDWSGLVLDGNVDAFMFAIPDDASNPVATIDSTPSYTAVSTGTVVEQNYVEFDTLPNTSGPTNQGIYIGQPVVFTGTTFGGIVAGKKYYVADYVTYDGNSKFAISVSETVNPEVLDITYPAGVGGDPGLEVPLTTATGSMTATFYNYDIVWEGTAGDQASGCCFNLTAPGLTPARLMNFVYSSGAFPSIPGYWWIERANPSYGIFPAWWTYTATL